MNQHKIAIRLGVNQSTISRIYNGKLKPRWQLAKKMAKMCRCGVSVFYEGTPDEIQAAMQRLSTARLSSRAKHGRKRVDG